MPPLRKLHVTNAAGRDATVDFQPVHGKSRVRLGLPGREVRFRRYLATTEEGLHEALAARFGEDYAEALVQGDPEIDLELVGRTIDETSRVYLTSKGEVLHVEPRIVEVLFGPDGAERERRSPEDREANVNDELPVRWTGRRIPRAEVVRRFVFRRTLQLRHQDGLTYDYLHAMAKELDEADVVVRMGAGPKGKDALVLTTNGMPYHAFLEGRVDGERYMLLLHLSNLELKAPEGFGGAAGDGAAGDEEAGA